VSVGQNTMWLFEDRLTVQYQVQEMLRTERIFEAEGIAEELAAYNPLIPDGRNWKVTFLIEYPDAEIRRVQLERLKGIEDRCWVQAAGCARLYAIADEDLERENEVKTSAVHFLRFELDEATVSALKRGAALAMGIDHPNYRHELAPVSENVRAALISDRGRNQAEQRCFTGADPVDGHVQDHADQHHHDAAAQRLGGRGGRGPISPAHQVERQGRQLESLFDGLHSLAMILLEQLRLALVLGPDGDNAHTDAHDDGDDGDKNADNSRIHIRLLQ
jgi:hypothetical protein